ncbi:MAG: UvrD-helicase domain-containing protein [Nitrospirae bacterium]|nr:UvrD-helicase domain-containing protein [Nitrospirota bacterium]MCL5422653.1 UvrD-helicase domain-containing protein [Nitrospirota bacterium]
MADSILIKDTEMQFPHFTVLKASAGSGKTRTLTKRFAQFILSEEVPRNRLRNMLAITFSNNAAKEMKGRTLSWLKSLYFGEEKEVGELSGILSLGREEMREKAGLLIDEILGSYSDFQVKTIDSFMTTVFKTSAMDFGYNPDFEILMSSDSLMEYSFSVFLRNVREGAAEAASLEEIIDFLLEQKRTDASFLWDPSAALLDEIKKLYRKLASTEKRPKMEDHTDALRGVKERITGVVEAIEKEIEESGLKRHGNSSFKSVLPLVRAKSFPDLIGKTFTNPPVTRPQKAGERAAYEQVLRSWSEVADLINQYAVLFARSRCMPYVRAYDAFSRTVEMAKRQQGKVFIEDINMHLAEYLNSAIVPDVYFRIGETIFHFLIDEFQDTSPIQWRNLFPLIENSLSQGGSLFVVGDTKQAIYGFRNADYTIMKRLESKNPFPSAVHEVKELDTNYRSRKRILEFNERVFKESVAQNAAYREAGDRSGLTRYVQKPEGGGSDGHAEISLLERNDEEPAEREKIQGLIEELRRRGYRYGDIAVLTQTNDDAVRTTGWLNEKEIPFISYSSLDVRMRKITGEIVALLNFLDSPTDDFSFGTFILGEVFAKALARDQGAGVERLREFCFLRRENPPLYKAFETEFSHLWKRYFEGLFRASGFLPLYDLVTEIFAVFKVFENLPEEEATLVKVLEVVKDFEGAGFNSLKDFLETAAGDGDGESEWNMAVPKGIDAVQVMTIHKAKGLGFPVVIVLLYEVKNRGFDYIIEEDDESVTLLKISKTIAACDRTLQLLYDEERMRELVNRLNSLYVGFTRPEQELYVVGVKSNDKGYPFDLLPADEYSPSEKPESGPGTRSSASVAPRPCSLLHRPRQLEFPAGPEEFMTLEEKRRGEFIHRVLFFIDYGKAGFEKELDGIIERVRDERGTDYPGEEVKKVIIALIDNEETGVYFREAPGREIRKEQEYADGSGRLFRMDRVVIDPDCVTVVDFKTGKKRDALEKYRAQMCNYMKILGEVYSGKTVRGVISFIDLDEVEKIG